MSHSVAGAQDRRTFVKNAALAAAAATGLSGGLGGLSGLLAEARPAGRLSRSVLGTGGARPFNMICLGDSVMWGQGLRDSEKFTSQVETWLESQLPGRTVDRRVYARSGATITSDPHFDESKIEPWMNDRSLGEVPCSWPYVDRQVGVARDDLASQGIPAQSVDLVLLDGGINDVNIKTILNPFGLMDLPALQKTSSDLCVRPMTRLLPEVRTGFPNAKILVTGYFPIVSKESDLLHLGLLLSLVFGPAGFVVSTVLQGRLAQQSDTFHTTSDEGLGAAVASLNRTWNPDPMYNTPIATFAKIPWAPAHSYGGSESRLYLVHLPNDPVYYERRAACETAGQLENPGCLDAKMGHPNAAGARAYASACTAQLTRYLPEWRGARLMSACVEMDPMPAVGAATTLTVRATEVGTSGRKVVPGTVRVGRQTFATDTAMPLTLCSETVLTAVDRTGVKPQRERETGTSCAPLIVSAPGYVDVVIRDYLKAQPLPR